MPPRFRLSRSVLPLLVPAVAGVFAAGCGSEAVVTSYKVPKTTEHAARPAAGGEYRILGAIYPADNPVWFFKLTGSTAQIGEYEAEFEKLAASVQLPATPDGLPTFTLPDGWKRGGPRSVTRAGITVRFDETVQFGPPAAPLEITVSKSGGEVFTNVERWAGQVGLKMGPGDLGTYTRPFDAAGVKGLRVDVRGSKNPAGGGPMMGRGK